MNTPERTELEAWHSAFGTSQLSHAVGQLAAEKARADKAEAWLEAKTLALQEQHERADKAEAACAEMRQVIESFRWADPFAEKSKHAISTDCGKGWLSPEKVKLLRDIKAKAALAETEAPK